MKNKFKLRLVIVHLFYICLALMVFSAQAKAQDVNLLLLFEENQEKETTMGEEHFERLIRIFRLKSPMPLIPVYIPFGYDAHFSKDWFLEQIKEAGFRSEHKIKTLIIATHGETTIMGKRTILHEVGGFGPSGAFGNLKPIIEVLKGRLAEQLHISLQACSTLCGTREQAEARARGLLSEFSGGTAKEISLWGAVIDLPIRYEGTMKSREELAEIAKSQARWGRLFKLLAIPFTLSLFSGSGLVIDQLGFASEVSATKFLSILGVSMTPLSYLFGRLYERGTRMGFEGFFLRFTKNGVERIQSDVFSPASVRGSSQRSCRKVFTN